MKIALQNFDRKIKNLLTVYLLVIGIGISVGLVYLASKTDSTSKGIIEEYNGSEIVDELEIPEKFPKEFKEMLVTTHSHILGLSTLLLSLGIIVYFSSLPSVLKSFLMIEPLISLISTFGSIWLVRYLHQDFIILTIISAIFMYGSIYLIIILSIYEINFRKIKNEG